MSSQDIELQPTVVWIILSMCGVAVILNIAVIVVIVRNGKRRTSVDVLLINLAVCDILLAGLVHPLFFQNVFLEDGDFIGGNVACKLIMFVPKFMIMTAVFTMLAIAADRHRVVLANKHLDRKGVLMVVAFVWCSGALSSAPQFYEYSIYEYEDEENNQTQTSCGSEGIIAHFETVYASILLVTYFIAFLLVNVWYGRVSYYVWRHSSRFETSNSHSPDDGAAEAAAGNRLQQALYQRKVKVLKMLISVTLSFITLWTPYFILFAIKEILDQDHTTYFATWPYLVSYTMSALSTIVNPTLYLVFCEAVQKAVASLFGCTKLSTRSDGLPTASKLSAGCQTSAGFSQSW